MNEREKSDRLVVPVKLPNNAAEAAAQAPSLHRGRAKCA